VIERLSLNLRLSMLAASIIYAGCSGTSAPGVSTDLALDSMDSVSTDVSALVDTVSSVDTIEEVQTDAAVDSFEPDETSVDTAPPSIQIKQVQDKIFALSCTFSKCHSATQQAAGLDLTGDSYSRLVGVSAKQNPSWKLVDPGAPEQSWLWHKVVGNPPSIGNQMPPQQALDKERQELLKQWIVQGAAP